MQFLSIFLIGPGLGDALATKEILLLLLSFCAGNEGSNAFRSCQYQSDRCLGTASLCHISACHTRAVTQAREWLFLTHSACCPDTD